MFLGPRDYVSFWFTYVGICSSEELFNKEVDKLKRVFTLNGYPKAFFKEAYEKFCTSLARDRTTEVGLDDIDTDEERKYTFGITFVGTPSREYKKIKDLIKEHLSGFICLFLFM